METKINESSSTVQKMSEVSKEFELNEVDTDIDIYETIIVGRGHSRPVVDVSVSQLVEDSFW